MNSTASNHSMNRRLSVWFNRRLLWLSKHWLAVANLFFFTYVGLPILAPILLASGFTGAANVIYQMYNAVCHQFPTRTYFIFGQQVAMCERCIAIYIAFFATGLVFNFARYKALPLRWYLLFALPMAVDGVSAFVSEMAAAGVSLLIFWGIWLVCGGLIGLTLYRKNALDWQFWLVFAAGIAALGYLQFVGLRISNNLMRTITGAIFGFGTVWFAYPILEEGFKDTWHELNARLAPPDDSRLPDRLL